MTDRNSGMGTSGHPFFRTTKSLMKGRYVCRLRESEPMEMLLHPLVSECKLDLKCMYSLAFLFITRSHNVCSLNVENRADGHLPTRLISSRASHTCVGKRRFFQRPLLHPVIQIFGRLVRTWRHTGTTIQIIQFVDKG